jgi:DNA processing protein
MSGRVDDNERDLFYWLGLHMAPGVGARTFRRLIEVFGSPEAVFRAGESELSRIPRLPKGTADALARFNWGGLVEKEIADAGKAGIRLIKLNDADYPPRLKEIYDPPPVMWMAGEIVPEDRAAVAIVGSRGATEWGRRTAGKISADLAALGVTVVSGNALGVDAAAHRAALEAGGRTIGVLGCGLDVLYPRPNRDLVERVPRQGAILSEFPLGTEPKPGHFPQRNRIISGLSAAVLVVEAGEKSGALITARMALEQNREVLAVPGRAGSIKSRGTNALLRQGAALVETAQDVLEAVGRQLEVAAPAPGTKPGRNEATRTKTVPAKPVLTGDEGAVFDILGEEPLHVDDLGRRAGLTPVGLAPILLNMELAGLVRQWPGNRYTRN